MSQELIQKLPWPGILECSLKHKVESTTFVLDYKGPKIDAEEWHKLMSFFRWTNSEHHSEAQARGFIDPVQNKVIFWAFPQKGKTGMKSDEIAGEEFNKQRLALPNADKLTYFFTVHHHCSCSAFQSSADERNEQSQDGLHITVGNMSNDIHDMDARFYLEKVKMTPDLDVFWDIGNFALKMIPKDMHKLVARHQMCSKIDLAFPDAWKANYIIEVTKPSPTVTHTYRGGMGYSEFTGYGGVGFESLQEKITRVAAEVVEDAIYEQEPEIVKKTFQFLRNGTILDSILTKGRGERFDAFDIGRVIEECEDNFDSILKKMIEGTETLATGEVAGETKKQRKARMKAEKLRIERATNERSTVKVGQIVGGNGNGNGDAKKFISVAEEMAAEAKLKDEAKNPTDGQIISTNGTRFKYNANEKSWQVVEEPAMDRGTGSD